MERTKVQNKSQKQVYLGSNLSSTQFEIDEKAYGLIIDRLTDLYNNPLLSAIREIISNAIDSTVEAGSSKDIEIHCPSKIEPWFEVTDYGLGMDKETLEQVYTKFGASTKGENLNQIGSYGLGAKAPLAYTNILTIRSVKDGKVTSGIISRDDTGIFMSLNEPESIDEHNGFSIQFNILPDDVENAQGILKEFSKNSYIVDGVEFKFSNLVGEAEAEELFRLKDIELPTGDKLRFYINTRGIEFLITRNNYREPYKFNTHSVRYNLQGFLYNLPSDEYEDRGIKHMFVVELLPGYVDFNSSRDSITTTEKTGAFKDFMSKYLENLTLGELNIVPPITILESLNKHLGYSTASELYSLLTNNIPTFKDFLDGQDFSKVLFLHDIYYSDKFRASLYHGDEYTNVGRGGLTEIKRATGILTNNGVSTENILEHFVIRSKSYRTNDIVLYNVVDNISVFKVRKRIMDELQLSNTDNIRVISFDGNEEEALDSFNHFPGRTHFLDYKYLLNKNKQNKNTQGSRLTTSILGELDIVGKELTRGTNDIKYLTLDEIVAFPKDYQVFITHDSKENTIHVRNEYRELSSTGISKLLSYYKLSDTEIVEGKPLILLTSKRKGDLVKIVEHFDNVFYLRFSEEENKTQRAYAESYKTLTGKETINLYDLLFTGNSVTKGTKPYKELMETLDMVRGNPREKLYSYVYLYDIKELYSGDLESTLDNIDEEMKSIGTNFNFDSNELQYVTNLIKEYQSLSDEEVEELELYNKFDIKYPLYAKRPNKVRSRRLFRILKDRNKFKSKVEKLRNNFDKYVEGILENEESPSMYDLGNLIGRLEWKD